MFWKSSFQARQTLALCCTFMPLILRLKALTFKIIKRVKFRGPCGDLEAKKYFQRQLKRRYLGQTLDFK